MIDLNAQALHAETTVERHTHALEDLLLSGFLGGAASASCCVSFVSILVT